MTTIYGLEEYERFSSENSMEKLSAYTISQINEKKEQFASLLSVCKFAPIFVVCEHSEEDINRYRHKSKYYLNFYIPAVIFNSVVIIPSKAKCTDKTFSFSLHDKITSSVLTNFSLDRYGLDKSPKKVDAATAEKMKNWVDYLQSIETQKRLFIADVETKISDFRKSLEQYGDAVHYYSQSKNSGEARLGGLIYHFNISESGRIEQQIITTLRISEMTIDNFMLMADNKYNK